MDLTGLEKRYLNSETIEGLIESPDLSDGDDEILDRVWEQIVEEDRRAGIEIITDDA